MIRRASSFLLVLLVLYSCWKRAEITGYGVARQSLEELSDLLSKWEKSLLPEKDDATLSAFREPQDRALHPKHTFNNDVRRTVVDFEIVQRAQIEVALDPTTTEKATSEVTEPLQTTSINDIETVISEASVTEETEVFVETAVVGTETPTENRATPIPTASRSEQPSPTALEAASTESISTFSFTEATEIFLETQTFVVETEAFFETLSATPTAAEPSSDNPSPTSTPSSSTSTSTRSPTRTPTVQPGSVVAVLRLNFLYEAWLADEESEAALFVSEMATQLGVAESRVDVLPVTSGSTIVTCAVAPQTSGSIAGQSAIVATLTSSTFTLPSFEVLSVSASIQSIPSGDNGGTDGGGSAAFATSASFTLLALCVAVLFALSSAL